MKDLGPTPLEENNSIIILLVLFGIILIIGVGLLQFVTIQQKKARNIAQGPTRYYPNINNKEVKLPLYVN
jgi:hypothetical protein